MAIIKSKVTGLITSQKLSELADITAGTLSYDGDITWLKFVINGKSLLIADRNIRTGLSWDDLMVKGLISGRSVTIGDTVYNCRLMTGGNGNPTNSRGGEWEDLIIPHYPNDEDSNWQGVYTWCREIYSSLGGNDRVVRGRSSVDTFGFAPTTYNDSYYGWRPVLEYERLITTSPLEQNSTTINAINKVSEIKSSLKAQHNILGEKLKSLGVEVLSTDKMSDLINKVSDFNTIEYVAGSSVTSRVDTKEYNVDTKEYKLLFSKNISEIRNTFNEFPVKSVKMSFHVNCYLVTSSTYTLYFRYRVYRQDNTEISTHWGQVDYPGGSQSVGLIDKHFDIQLPSDAYRIDFFAYTTSTYSSASGKISNIKYGCEGLIDNKYTVGKKWARGTSQSSTSRRTFIRSNNVSETLYYIQVSDLGFTPRTVHTYYKRNNINQYNFTCDVSEHAYEYWVPLGNSGYSYQCTTSVDPERAYLANSGFLVPIYTTQPICWIAFE